jgi:hypothetical protein
LPSQQISTWEPYISQDSLGEASKFLSSSLYGFDFHAHDPPDLNSITVPDTVPDSEAEASVGPSNGRSFTCGDCKRQFTRRSDLSRHQLQHSQPSFDCTVAGCDRIGPNGYRRKDKLVEHQRACHPPAAMAEEPHVKVRAEAIEDCSCHSSALSDVFDTNERSFEQVDGVEQVDRKRNNDTQSVNSPGLHRDITDTPSDDVCFGKHRKDYSQPRFTCPYRQAYRLGRVPAHHSICLGLSWASVHRVK